MRSEHILMKLGGVDSAADRKSACRVLRSVDGVRTATVRGDTARVAFYPDRTTVPIITETLAAAGYVVV